MKQLILSVTFVLGLCGVAWANSEETGHITRLLVEGSSTIYVSVWIDGTDNTSECSGGARWTIQDDQNGFREKLSMLMLAYAKNEQVRLYYASSSGCGSWTR